MIYLVTGTNPADLPQKDFRIQFQQVANLSPSFTNWLQRITEPSLEKRFSTATQALTALEYPEETNIKAITIGKPAGSKIQLTKNEEYLKMIEPSLGNRLRSANEAITVLDEPQLQNASTLIAKKPIRTKVQLTKIQLTKNEDVLEIIIPPSFSWWKIFSLILIVPFCMILISPVIFAISAISDLLSFLIIFGLSWYMLCLFIFDTFGHIRLRIDSQEITLTYKLFGLLFYWRKSSRRDNHSISKLVYIPKHDRLTAQGETQEPAKLEIWAGAKKYGLSIPNDRVSIEREIEWLVHELSDWLGIEIEIKIIQ
jgi:hypothetical protein